MFRLSDTRLRVSELLAGVETLRLIMGHPSAPPFARIIAACSVGYLFSPIQFIPTFIPVIGQLDDLLVLVIAIGMVRRLTPRELLKECEDLARSSSFILRFSSSESFEVSTESPR
jgi:uncharacterized membrane protein YkvA (DUF1232 family)